jgi:hypothetical protein
MNIDECIELLELKKPYTNKELKKNYLKKCLEYHPDKNKNGIDMFKKIQEAYNILKKINIENCNIDIEEEFTDLSYTEILNNYINKFSNKYGWSNEFIKKTIEKIFINAEEISIKYLENIETDKLLEIYDYLMKYNQLFNIGSNLLEECNKIINKKIKDEKIIILNPSIEDLINDNIYVLDIEEERFYVPLWHNELYYKNNYIIRIIPELNEKIYIDDENNIHIKESYKIDELIKKEKEEINVGGKILIININELLIKRYQQKVFKDEGISKINEKELFKNNKRSDIIIHINIT